MGLCQLLKPEPNPNAILGPSKPRQALQSLRCGKDRCKFSMSNLADESCVFYWYVSPDTVVNKQAGDGHLASSQQGVTRRL